MTVYHKIQTVFLRDPETNYKTLLEGQWAKPEFELLKDNRWTFTEKVDGTNIRLFLGDDWPQKYNGKTDNAQLPPRLPPVLDNALERLVPVLCGKAVVYGEGCGAGIQKGGEISDDQLLVLFDIAVPYRDGTWIWLERESLEDIAQKAGLRIAPVIGQGTLQEMIEKVRAGITTSWDKGEFQAEGIVARPSCELKNRFGERIITKLKAKDFLR